MATSPETFRSLVRALEPYFVWLKALALLNGIGWATFEIWAYADAARLTADGRWTARTSVWVALLLFDVLVVVWWYADVACRQYRLAEQTRAEQNRPFAVIDRSRMCAADHAAGDAGRYVARNLGSGLAVNVFYVTEDDAGLAIQSMGALAGSADRALSESIERPLRAARGAAHHFVVVAEGLASQPGRWTVTANVLLPTGEVAHRVVWLEPEKRSDSLRAWLDWHWPAVKAQIAALDNQR